MTIAELNASDHGRFVEALGWIFEHSPWVAERVWAHRPFATREDLHRAMMHEVRIANEEEQRALLRAHPDLGTKARMSDASVGEQAGAGLDRLTPADYQRLQTLTSEYRERFGFPFLLAVKDRTTQDVFDTLSTRLRRDADAEWREALDQVSRIASFRLNDVVK
jgi:2-oxo-4-hydroxy-4-carboxy-5-ureidoimidazoline decarboxylase